MSPAWQAGVPLWTSAEAVEATGGRGAAAWACFGISADSRKVEAGDLFVAIEGPNADGHDFVADALAAGAVAALVGQRPEGVAEDAPLLVVDDTMAALEKLARAARERAQARVIAVTGSVGKTGAKEALKLLLSAAGPSFANPASFNNQWGVPLSLAALPRAARFGVFEIGMNHAGEIAPLADMVRPDVAVVTNIEPVHIEFFASIEAICDAKAEIFGGMDAGGTAVLNRDDRFYDRLVIAADACGVTKVVSFGEHADATVRLVEAEIETEHSDVTVALDGTRIVYRLGAPGRHWVTTSLAALAAVHAVGADAATLAPGLAEMRPLAGRGARERITLDGDGFTLIDESYNANPASMRGAIALLGGTPPGEGGRRIAVLGDMRELGAAAPKLHATLADALIGARVDQVFTVGRHMARLRDVLPADMRAGHAEHPDHIAVPVAAVVRSGDVVLVKGSRGGGVRPAMRVIIDALRARDGEPSPRAVGSG